MGWSSMTVLFCFLAAISSSIGNANGELNTFGFDEITSSFEQSFVSHLIKSGALGQEENQDVKDVSGILLKLIQKVSSIRALNNPSEERALMVFFASELSSIIVDNTKTLMTALQQANAVTNALRQAYIDQGEPPNDKFIDEVKFLIGIFLDFKSSSDSDSSDEETSISPSVGATKPENPLAKSENPMVTPKKPLPAPENALLKSGNPLTKPESPLAKPESSFGKPEKPLAKPESPLAKPESPLAKPESPLAKPESPLAKPEKPLAKPEKPLAKPEKPLAKPEKPLKSENPLAKNPLAKPQNPLQTPENPLQTPINPFPKPENSLKAPENSLTAQQKPLMPKNPSVTPMVTPATPVMATEMPKSTQEKCTIKPEKPSIEESQIPSPIDLSKMNPPIAKKPPVQESPSSGLSGIADGLDAVLMDGNTYVPQLINAIRRSKGPGTLNFQYLVRQLSPVYSSMLHDQITLSQSETFVRFLVETLIAALEIIRSSDMQCLQIPSNSAPVFRYIEAFNHIVL